MPYHRLHFAFIALIAAVVCARGPAQASDQPGPVSATTANPASAGPTTASVSAPSPACESTPTTSAPAPAETVPMTTRQQAIEKARLGAGRDNPFAPFNGTGEFAFGPKPKAIKPTDSEVSSARKTGLVPPPPPVLGLSPAPPPPPVEGKASFQLPEPPSRPKLVQDLKLVGIVGQKALFVFSDPQVRKINNWPRNLTLSPGEQFESVNLISVDDHLVTLEEDGIRTVKELEQIR